MNAAAAVTLSSGSGLAPQPAAPLPRIVRMPTKFGSREPKFLLKHLSKAGGTFGQWLISNVLSSGHWAFQSDDMNFPPWMQQRFFTAITMRNPCDLYLSYAHFFPGKVYGYKHPTFGPNPIPPDYDLPYLDTDLFEQWVLNSRCQDLTGFYSFYVWQNLIAPECMNWYRLPAKRERTATSARCENATRMRADLEAFSPLGLANCWVFTETLMEDFRTCFRAYEESHSWARGSVDWGRFERIANGSLRFHASNKVISKSDKRHPPCGDYFASSGTLNDTIRASDPHLFEKFGYTGCCQPSNHVLM